MLIPLGTNELPARKAFPLVTAGLFFVNIVVFIYQMALLYSGGAAALSLFIDRYAVVPSRIAAGQGYETLVTSVFIHAGLLHLASNMLFLVAFGDNVEDRLGRGRFLVFYVACGVAASLTQVAFGPDLIIPTIGASGAIAGILGAYLAIYPQGQIRSIFLLGFIPIPIRMSAALFIVAWFVTQFFSGVSSLGVTTAETGGIAYFAHIGGFVMGFLVIRLLLRRKDLSLT